MPKNEPNLCPDCPLKTLIPHVKTQSYTRTAAEQSTVNLCSKLRALAKKWGWPGCSHYPQNERIDLYATQKR